MDLFMVIFRILHIVAGVVWVGGGLTMAFVIGPTAERMGQQSGSFMMNMFAYSIFNKAIMISAIVSTVAGLALYDKVTDHFQDSDYLSSGGGIVLSIGVVAGLLAAGHGGGTIGRMAGQYANLAKQVLAAGGTPSPEQGTEFAQLAAKIKRNSQISVILMVVAVVCMSAARYV